ncbi:phage holin family protein [Ancylothrix sp. C2]|uniref:phage holin family protein n=1 Tax=Ancylothrix sp. D3o TaxID=2953691 RepID=UPI0021BBAE52|nr:phage holin family protein [Ancylothrix sp. D3o]MCT7948900.1 phage holin family protein [Ancylothrix sp. D3o]
MPRFLLTWLLTAVALLITSYVVPGFYVANFSYAAVAAVILGLANAIVRPVLVLLTLPLTILSLGLFLFVVNAIVLSLVGFLMPNAGFRIDGFWPALLGSIVLSVVTGVLNRLVFKEE